MFNNVGTVDRIMCVMNKMVADLDKCRIANSDLYSELNAKATVAGREADRATRIMKNLQAIVEA